MSVSKKGQTYTEIPCRISINRMHCADERVVRIEIRWDSKRRLKLNVPESEFCDALFGTVERPCVEIVRDAAATKPNSDQPFTLAELYLGGYNSLISRIDAALLGVDATTRERVLCAIQRDAKKEGE